MFPNQMWYCHYWPYLYLTYHWNLRRIILWVNQRINSLVVRCSRHCTDCSTYHWYLLLHLLLHQRWHKLKRKTLRCMHSPHSIILIIGYLEYHILPIPLQIRRCLCWCRSRWIHYFYKESIHGLVPLRRLRYWFQFRLLHVRLRFILNQTRWRQTRRTRYARSRWTWRWKPWIMSMNRKVTYNIWSQKSVNKHQPTKFRSPNGKVDCVLIYFVYISDSPQENSLLLFKNIEYKKHL